MLNPSNPSFKSVKLLWMYMACGAVSIPFGIIYGVLSVGGKLRPWEGVLLLAAAFVSAMVVWYRLENRWFSAAKESVSHAEWIEIANNLSQVVYSERTAWESAVRNSAAWRRAAWDTASWECQYRYHNDLESGQFNSIRNGGHQEAMGISNVR